MIEPCCIDNQLPMAVREQKGRAIVATSGDVMAHHWYRAISYQAGPTNKLRLQVRDIDMKLLRNLRTWMQRGWTTHVQITTREDRAELIMQELSGVRSEECISIAADKMLQTELMAMEGIDGLVMIIGPMLSDPQPGSMLYTVYSKRDYEAVKEVLAVVDNRHKAHRIKSVGNNNNNKAYELDKENQGEEGAEAQVEGNGTDRKRVRNARKARTKRDGALGREVKADVHRAAPGAADDAQG
jgi:hypothetical protein